MSEKEIGKWGESKAFFAGCAIGGLLYLTWTFASQLSEINQATYETFPFSLFYFEYKDLIPFWPQELTNELFVIYGYLAMAVGVILAAFITELLYHLRILRSIIYPTIIAGMAWTFTLAAIISILNGTSEIMALV